MGDGDTSGGGYNDSAKAAAAFLQSDMNMQNTVSSYHGNKMTNFMSPSLYYHHDQLHKHQDSTGIGSGLVLGNEISINNRIASGISLQPSSGSDTGGVTEGSGKVLFTATQWQELERQTTIYKYIMASIPVPPQLLIPQSNKAGMDLRFSNGSDPEPWRCRRTDGKKWRCSRDVAPDQKYCERHVHKSRPRSRKPVEIPSHNTNVTTTALNTTPAYNTNMPSAVTSSYQHPSEWFVKSGAIPVSSSNQQFQQSTDFPRVGSKRNHIFPQYFEGNHQGESVFNYGLDTSSSSAGDASAGTRRQQHFIDAWSRSGGVAADNCSLTLSMQCSGGMDQSFQIGGDSDVLKSHNQWLSQASWMGSPPGGPLGEALGLGITTTVNPHGHSTSTTTSSSCDNSGSHDHELSFIR